MCFSRSMHRALMMHISSIWLIFDRQGLSEGCCRAGEKTEAVMMEVEMAIQVG